MGAEYMRNKKEIFTIIDVVLIFIMVVSLYYFVKNKKIYELKLPDVEILSSITIEEDNKITLDEKTKMNEILSILNGVNRISRVESVQDVPVNATSVITINFNFKEAGSSIVFVYKKKKKFYIEQPYNGIYEISESEYNSIKIYN